MPNAAPPTTTGGPFWSRSDPKLDSDGRVVRGGMFPHQRAWWDLPNFIRLFVGGFGAGKTMIGSKWSIAMALENAPILFGYVAPTYVLARSTGVETLVELLGGKERNLSGFSWTYNKSLFEFFIRYRGREGRIKVYSGEDPLSLRGPNLCGAWIDEPFIQDHEVFRQMIARVRHPEARVRAIGMTGTPEQLNWGYDLAEGELRGRHDVGIVRASSRDNLALPKEYLTNLEGAYVGKAAQAYIGGQFVSLSEGAVYYAFDRAENVVRLEIPAGAELGVGMDFNVDPMAAVMFWRLGDHIHFFEEFELRNADTEFMCDTLRAHRYGSPRYLREVYPDASGRSRKTSSPGGASDFTFLRRAGFSINARPANPHRRDRYNAVNAMLKPTKTGQIGCTIDPDCRSLIKGLTVYTYENMNTPLGKGLSHILDAFGYPISYLYPVDKQSITTHRLTGV